MQDLLLGQGHPEIAVIYDHVVGEVGGQVDYNQLISSTYLISDVFYLLDWLVRNK